MYTLDTSTSTCWYYIPFTWTNPGWIWISVNLDSTQIERLHGTFHEQLLVWFINLVSWLRDNATQTVTSAQWPEAAWSSAASSIARCCLLPCKIACDPSAKTTECLVPMFSAWRRKIRTWDRDLRAYLRMMNGHRRFFHVLLTSLIVSQQVKS